MNKTILIGFIFLTLLSVSSCGTSPMPVFENPCEVNQDCWEFPECRNPSNTSQNICTCNILNPGTDIKICVKKTTPLQ